MNMDDLVNVNKRPCMFCRPSKQYNIYETSLSTLSNSIVTCDSKYQVIIKNNFIPPVMHSIKMQTNLIVKFK